MDREEKLQEFFEHLMEEGVAQSVETAYQELLEENLDYQLDELPEDMREDLASTAAEVYAEQARDIMSSTYLDESELGLAMATAFLDDENVSELGSRTRAVMRDYSGRLEGLDYDTYERRALTVLADPWPEQDLGTGAERFKDPKDDPAFY